MEAVKTTVWKQTGENSGGQANSGKQQAFVGAHPLYHTLASLGMGLKQACNPAEAHATINGFVPLAVAALPVLLQLSMPASALGEKDQGNFPSTWAAFPFANLTKVSGCAKAQPTLTQVLAQVALGITPIG